MPFPGLSTSHYAWLAVYYSKLRDSGLLELLAPEGRAAALADAVEDHYPLHAEEIRQWNNATRVAMLGVLDDLTIKGPVKRQTLLWEALKGGRQVSCVAIQLPQGIDVQLLVGGAPERTALLFDRPLARREALLWREELAAEGWLIREV